MGLSSPIRRAVGAVNIRRICMWLKRGQFGTRLERLPAMPAAHKMLWPSGLLVVSAPDEE